MAKRQSTREQQSETWRVPPSALALSAAVAVALMGAGCAEESTGEAESPEVVGEVDQALVPAVTVTATADTYVINTQAAKNFGTLTSARVASAGSAKALVAASQAAITAALGPAATVTDATLRIPVASNGGGWGAGAAVKIHRMTTAWTEAGATWGCAVDSNTGNSVPDCSGATLWNMGTPTVSSPNPWVSTQTAQFTFLNTSILGTDITFDVTADVNAFLGGSASNFGWILLRTDSLAPVANLGTKENGGVVAPSLVMHLGTCQAGFHDGGAGVCLPNGVCATGLGDCDGDGTCETDLFAPGNCGVCGQTCDDGNQCTSDSCGPGGVCAHVPVADGTSCSDSASCVAETVCSAGVCAAPTCTVPGACPAQNCNPQTISQIPSLMLTSELHAAVLNRFPLQNVMDAIVASARVQTTGKALFQQLWDTHSTAATGIFPSSPHCDDNGGTINGFAITCPRVEGVLATSEPYLPQLNGSLNPHFWIPIGLFNRFDIAVNDPTTCGEYRIIYGKQSGLTDPNDRITINFEAVLPNPVPGCIEACRPVAEFWASLTNITDQQVLGDKLVDFYFNGLPGFKPVVRAENYGLDTGSQCGTAGQVRTNIFMEQPWILREFHLGLTCGPNGKELQFLPVKLGESPAPSLFGPAPAGSQAEAFQQAFLSQVPGLAAATAPIEIAMTSDDQFYDGDGESGISGSVVPWPRVTTFFNQGGADTGPFGVQIQNVLTSVGSTLTPFNIVRRAESQTCIGCHQFSANVDIGGGLIFPPSITWKFVGGGGFQGFVHLREDGKISGLLSTMMLPHRQQVLEDFLACN